MTRPRAAGLLGSLLLALVLVGLAAPSSATRAAVSAKRPTALALSFPTSVLAGTHPLATVRLTSNGAPVAGQLVSIRLDGKVTQQVTTGATGTATADILRNLAAGQYQMSATFAGTTVYASAASASITFTVVPVVPTSLSLEFPTTLDLGAHPTANVRLMAGSQPLGGQTVSIRLDDRITQQLTTAADGTATADIARDLSAGRHTVVASFAGTPGFRSSASPTVTFTIKPVELAIATVPALPDMPLVRVGNGPVLKTGADGVVHATMTSAGPVTLHMALPADTATQQVRLVRWDDGTTDAARTIRIPDTLQLSVGLEVRRPVAFAFAASDGTPIDASQVGQVHVSDGAGNETVVMGSGPGWLASNAIARLSTGLASSPIQYRIDEVDLGGVNVVNRGQQRFTVDRPVTIQVPLLVFSLDVQGRDALLRMPTGAKVTITPVDGPGQVLPLDGSSRTSTRLPRGEYRLAVGGIVGIPLSTPVVLSKDQLADVLIITPLDIAIVGAVALVLMAGLVFLGRPHLLRRRRTAVAAEVPVEAAPTGVAWPDPETSFVVPPGPTPPDPSE